VRRVFLECTELQRSRTLELHSGHVVTYLPQHQMRNHCCHYEQQQQQAKTVAAKTIYTQTPCVYVHWQNLPTRLHSTLKSNLKSTWPSVCHRLPFATNE